MPDEIETVTVDEATTDYYIASVAVVPAPDPDSYTAGWREPWPAAEREPNRPLDPPSVAAAKDRWRLSFQRRVALADQVLAGADGDNAPTPSGAGDD